MGMGRLLVLLAALTWWIPQAAQAQECDLELILAIDVSGSIDPTEFDIQNEGAAAAFRNPALIEAISRLPGGVMATVTQWSGSSRQRQVVPWTRLSDQRSMAGFADAITAAGRVFRHYSTAIGEALVQADAIGRDNPVACRRRVIDVSGDGVNNEGRGPRPVSLALSARGRTINGLVIRGADPDPVAHYRDEVISGPGAFLEVAEGFEDYPRAILKKLLREVDPDPVIVSPRLPTLPFRMAGRAPGR